MTICHDVCHDVGVVMYVKMYYRVGQCCVNFQACQACDLVVITRCKLENSTICIFVRGIPPQHPQHIGHNHLVVALAESNDTMIQTIVLR